MGNRPEAAPAAVAASFAAIYLIWGSTYLTIAWAVETMPPLGMAGVRFIVAGGLLWLLVPRNGAPNPTAKDWGWAFLLGGLLFLLGNGMVSVVEQKMPSGATALLITSVPMWMALIDWLRPDGTRPGWKVILGLLVGFSGVALLAGNAEGWKGGEVDYLYVALLLLGTLGWASGSILSRGSPVRQPILRSVALQMLAGGILLTVAGLARGELSGFDLGQVSARSAWSWAYMVVFGSIVAFSAYAWLLQVRPAAQVSTYAFVNPIVAVILGAAFLAEPVGPRTAAAAALVVGAVALLTWAKATAGKPAAATAGAPAK